jgi:hypothetical protein
MKLHIVLVLLISSVFISNFIECRRKHKSHHKGGFKPVYKPALEKENNPAVVKYVSHDSKPLGGSSTCLPPTSEEDFKGQTSGNCPIVCQYARCEQRGRTCCTYTARAKAETHYEEYSEPAPIKKMAPQQDKPLGGARTCYPPSDSEDFTGQKSGACPIVCTHARCEDRGATCCFYDHRASVAFLEQPHPLPKMKKQKPLKSKARTTAKAHHDEARHTCLPPHKGEAFKGSSVRICEHECPFSRCQQRHINCCYYDNPNTGKLKYRDPRKAAATSSNGGNASEFKGNDSFGNGYPLSTGSDSYQSKYGSQYANGK